MEALYRDIISGNQYRVWQAKTQGVKTFVYFLESCVMLPKMKQKGILLIDVLIFHCREHVI